MNEKNIKKYSRSIIEKKIGFFVSHQYLMLTIIGIVAIGIRLYYFQPDIPFSMDSLEYFIYSFDSSIQGNLPNNYSPANNGWPALVGVFFSLFHFDEPIYYMQLQKIISIIVSTITIIPIYFLGKYFFNNKLSLIAASFFAFEPRIIQNSLMGITEPLYILLISISLTMFLSKNKKMYYTSFGIVALASMVRGEAIILFFVMSVMFFIKDRKSFKVIPKYVPAVLIFILILLPMSAYKSEIHGDDRIFGRVIEIIKIHVLTPEENTEEWKELTSNQQLGIKERNGLGINFILTGIQNFVKFLIWNMIPIFIIFVPIGTLLILKNINYKKITIIASLVGLSIPAIYAYSISIMDTRYLYALYPMLAVISIFTVERFLQKNNYKNIILVILVSGILITSISFLEIKKIDVEHEKDAFEIAKYIVRHTTVVNSYSPESQYIKVAEVFRDWPSIPIHTSDGHFEVIMTRISTNGFESIDEFIKNSKNQGLSHIVIDNNSNRPDFLKDIFKTEDVSYLIKQYDSKEDSNLNYHVKIFEINYEEFDIKK
jgi:hypothetical protein